MKDNIKAFTTMEKELERKYPHKIIVMYDGEVVSIADTYIDAINAAKKKGITAKLFIHRLGPSKNTVAVLNNMVRYKEL